MSDDGTPTSTTFRYMSRFRCLGPACEANCCNGWQIYIDQEHHDRAREAMRSTKATRQEFGQKIKRVSGPTRSPSRYALIVLNNDGTCGFLTPTRSCGLQERYGEPVLSDTCSQYPRLVSVSGTRFEMAGTTSCPEVARQLLLYPDALELDEVDPAVLSRRKVSQYLRDHPEEPYVRYHDELRNLILDVLSDERFDLGVRLSLVAYFAERVSGFLVAQSQVLDEERLLAEVECIQDPTQRAMLAGVLKTMSPPPILAAAVAKVFVLERALAELSEQLRKQVLRSYLPTFEDARDLSPAELSRLGDEIVARYQERKVELARFAPRIDAYLTNYAKNYWVRSWYFHSSNLMMHTMVMLVLITVNRLLLLGHPLLAEISGPPSEAHADILDRAVVDTVFRFSRFFDHLPTLVDKLCEDFAANHAVTLAHAVSLAKF